MRRPRRRAGGRAARRAAALAALLGGCEAFTPPPIAPHVDATARLPRGTVFVEAVVTVAPDARAVELRPQVQISDDVRLGAGATMAWVDAQSEENWWQFLGLRLRAIRGFAVWNPAGADWAALDAGVGYGRADTGLQYLTLDAGGALASATRPLAGGGAMWFGGSVPLAAGDDWFVEHPRPDDGPHGDFPLFAVNDPPRPAPMAPAGWTRWWGLELFGVATWGTHPQRVGLDVALWSGAPHGGEMLAALGYGVGLR